MTCDACLKMVDKTESLVVSYQTKEVHDVCSECATQINAAMWRMREVLQDGICRFLQRLVTDRRAAALNRLYQKRVGERPSGTHQPVGDCAIPVVGPNLESGVQR